MGRGIVVQYEPSALCLKLWPHPGNALQLSSSNINVESAIDCLHFRHKFFKNHTLFVKTKDVISMVLILDFWKRNFWAFVMPLRSIACSDVSSLGHIWIPMTHPQLQCSQENWDCLDKSGWSLGMMWVSVASAHPWDCVGRTFCRSFSSVNLHGGFDESSPYWCLIHPTSFWESIDDLVSPFHGRLRLYLHFERSKDARFLDHPEDPHARL
jgi:hypothetical protein